MVESADGTLVSVKRLGQGPPLVLVHGAGVDRRSWSPVLPFLLERFTVHLVDRRGRRGSTAEAAEYDIKREGEDVAAVVEAAGRDVFLVGHSYGALCSLEAALITDAIGRLALYEPPMPTSAHPILTPEVMARLHALTDADDREGALKAFARQVLSASDYAVMTQPAALQAGTAVAHTLVRETTCVTVFDSSDRLSKITVPAVLILGTESPDFQRPANEAVIARLPNAGMALLEGHAHMGNIQAPEQFTRVLLGYFEGA